VNRRLHVPTMEGSRVRLEPLSRSHVGDLATAAEEDRSTYDFTQVPRAWEVEDFIKAHLRRAEDGLMVPFAQVRLSDGRAMGCTAYWDPRTWPDRLDLRAIMIGWTWLAVGAQRTGINTEAKLLLFTHAFETMGVVRVDLSTDARNERSQRAIAGLGARFEGVLRCWSLSHAPGEAGQLRDSALFSVIADEWSSIKTDLQKRLSR
jgi:RimJ/RimL family protein N-acetyltransferase